MNKTLDAKQHTITPILLCGGAGTRLWPLSRKSFPKQFSSLMGEKTLLQMTAARMEGAGFAAPIAVTNSDFRFTVAEQLKQEGIDPTAILIEPAQRNTAPAILAALAWLGTEHPDALVLIAPSDHVMKDEAAFQMAIKIGVEEALRGQLVTFGITPTYAETGYGYIELVKRSDAAHPLCHDNIRFVEKPTEDAAKTMLEQGGFLWNSGIFLGKVQSFIEAFEQHAPGLQAPVAAAVQDGHPDLDFFVLEKTAWNQAEDISIDYAVMEQAQNLSVVPMSSGWSDLGGWESVWRENQPDNDGLVAAGNVTTLDCKNSYLRAEGDNLELVGIGLDNIVAVAMPDAVLVSDISDAQNVKRAVSILKEKEVKQATTFPKDYRPWGWFESLVMGPAFQVKRIHVRPGAALSLQSHNHRSEHWIVVEGTAQVTIGDKVSLLTENQSVFIPLGEKHRLENPGKIPMVLIEVQTGSYLGEDDIVRYEDIYSRT